MIYTREEYGFRADDTLDIFQSMKAEDIQCGDRVLVKGGALKEAFEVRTFEPYDSLVIMCVGNYAISTRVGEKWLVDDWNNYVMEVAD